MLVDEIKDRVKIIELAKELGCEVTNAGFTNSIYKKEKNPSLKFYMDTNSFYCFAAGRGGDVINFYADYYNIDMKQAIKELADRYAITDKTSMDYSSPKINNERKIETKKSYLLNSERCFFDERAGILEYDGCLSRDEAEVRAWDDLLKQRKEIQLLIYESLEKYCFGLDDESLNYLMGNKRGLTLETIKKFRIFSIQDLDSTDSYLRNCFSVSDLIISGLYTLHGKLIFGNHRIIIPFIENGKIIYLRGRYFNNGNPEPKNTGKYIGLQNFSTNLTARRFFNKDILSSLKTDSKLMICEGEFDCMIAAQTGQNAIGIPGINNFPKEQINLLDNFEIYLAFDNDNAGEEATEKIGAMFNKKIRAIKLKNYKDITELVTYGTNN
jgi:DNA primase